MNAVYIKLRSAARKAGLIRLIRSLNFSSRHAGYEEQFHAALQAVIRPGDVVWDVGANVGYYTEIFCDWVMPDGLVVAFEPAKESFEAIRERLPDRPGLHLENVALSNEDAMGLLATAKSSVDRSLLTADSGDVQADPVTICRGDAVCERLGRVPNIIKIDVEGFEEEVLLGLDRTLLAPELRGVLVEIHFLKLERRGQQLAPVRIEKLLSGKGFEVKWIGPSNLQALRPTA